MSRGHEANHHVYVVDNLKAAAGVFESHACSHGDKFSIKDIGRNAGAYHAEEPLMTHFEIRRQFPLEGMEIETVRDTYGYISIIGSLSGDRSRSYSRILVRKTPHAMAVLVAVIALIYAYKRIEIQIQKWMEQFEAETRANVDPKVRAWFYKVGGRILDEAAPGWLKRFLK